MKQASFVYLYINKCLTRKLFEKSKSICNNPVFGITVELIKIRFEFVNLSTRWKQVCIKCDLRYVYRYLFLLRSEQQECGNLQTCQYYYLIFMLK